MESSLAATSRTRRTRIVCISDTHNCTVKLPKGDVLIHAGDLTNQGSYSELEKAIQWLEKAKFEAKIVIAGNHDVTLDQSFYSQNWQHFHNKGAQDSSRCVSLLASSRSITYLRHESATVRLCDPEGPKTEFKVFGSPYSPLCGLWAFGYDTQSPQESGPTASDIWRDIPPDIDILVTHTPARTYCDTCPKTQQHLGCEVLRNTLGRVRPRLHVCGHIHHGRGSKRVIWNTDTSGEAEGSVEEWQDPSPDPKSAKISLVDLTARGGNRPLDFRNPEGDESRKLGPAATPAVPSPEQGSLGGPTILGTANNQHPNLGDRPELGCSHPHDAQNGNDFDDFIPGFRVGPTATAHEDPSFVFSNTGRGETCVVNCAIVASNWPHVGGKKLNKPIVVDLDLPVW